MLCKTDGFISEGWTKVYFKLLDTKTGVMSKKYTASQI